MPLRSGEWTSRVLTTLIAGSKRMDLKLSNKLALVSGSTVKGAF